MLLFLILVAYMAALNRDQALPWAIAALLSATLITGVSWPHWLVKRLSVTRSGPQRAGEGDTVTFHVEVENHGWLPRFMVELVDRLPFVGAADGTASQGEKMLGVAAYVPGGGKRRFDVPLLCEKRGFYRLGPVGLASSFPLGLAEARQSRQDGVQTLTIYPEVFPIVALPLRGAPSQIHRGGFLLPEGAGAAEFSGLREYRRGDNPRHVHWPTTARRNELMVKEFEPLASACLYIALDLALGANLGKGKHATLEYAVRIAASVAKYACANSIPTRLIGQGARPLYLPAGTGDQHYRAMLDELAVVDADGATPYARVLENVALDCQPGETVLVFLSHPEAQSAPTLQALALLQARDAHLLAVDFDRASFLSSSKPTAASPLASGSLLELGAHCLPVRCGDDLVTLFNQ
ncbi:hypothetical protein SKTS_11530 [Sulfurimicrobium lacus]|uniref:DUF58 domain-containing protein n=1 Tax=Sulfurimicrobium lacus TaxID=2715678 RepID=A0A6F8VAX8_9PROT|nr:hypothetical protein SKTS_11530 [Sulfurimicrobium lacus]